MSKKTHKEIKSEIKALDWDKYYQHLPIPKEWNNVGDKRDELPSFEYDGFLIYFYSPNKEERKFQHTYIDGYKDDGYKDGKQVDHKYVLEIDQFGNKVKYLGEYIEEYKKYLDISIWFRMTFENFDDVVSMVNKLHENPKLILEQKPTR